MKVREELSRSKREQKKNFIKWTESVGGAKRNGVGGVISVGAGLQSDVA